MLAATLLLASLPLFAATAGAPTGDDLAACATPGQVEIRKDTWARIASPQYAANEGPREVRAFAIPESHPAWVYVTNGSVVQLSTSAGCTWDHVYPTPGQAPDSVATPRARVVTQLVAPEPQALWIASYDDAGGVPQPHVERTRDATPAPGNKTTKPYESVDAGLPAVGRPLQLVVSPVSSDRAYVLVETLPDAADGQTQAKRRIYRTIVDPMLDDAGLPGTTWDEVTVPLDAPAGLVTSPVKSSVVWTWSGDTYAFSADGGETWKTGRARGEITTIDVDGSGRAAVFTRGGEAGDVTFLDERGKEVARRAVPVAATSATHARRHDAYAVTGPDGTYGYDVNHDRWVRIHPVGVEPFERIAFGTSRSGRILLGQAEGVLFRLDLFAQESFLPPPPTIDGDGIVVNRPTGLTKPVLTVEKPTVTVAPGETVTNAVDFGVPPSPVPLDVFFLMDTTNSMGPAIAGLREGVKDIAANLKRRTNGSACFGVGDVKDESVTQGQGSSVMRPYRLVQPITCDLDELKRGVDELVEGGGNPTQAEGQTIALTQAVSGKGQLEPPAVLPGQDAKFTAPTRVIVLLTDAAFMQGEQGGFAFPTIDETVQTLNAYHDVKVVGVVVHDANDFNAALADVTAVVKGTNTYAPEFGVDCDSDGRMDVPPGEPLVCDTDNSAPAIEPAITALLLGVKDPGTIASRIDDPHNVVARVDGATDRIVDLKRENHLAYDLQLTCSAAQDGEDLPVRLVQTVRGDTVVAGEVVVRCRSPRVPDVPPPPVVADLEPDPLLPRPRPLVLALVPPAIQPPVPNNPISNVNPNAGFSQEEQQEFQVAAVTQDAQDDAGQEDVELAMSGVRPGDAAAAGLLLGAATVVSGAAYSLRRRTATQVVRARR